LLFLTGQTVADIPISLKTDDTRQDAGSKNYLEVAMVTVEEVSKKYGKRTSDILLSVANLVSCKSMITISMRNKIYSGAPRSEGPRERSSITKKKW